MMLPQPRSSKFMRLTTRALSAFRRFNRIEMASLAMTRRIATIGRQFARLNTEFFTVLRGNANNSGCLSPCANPVAGRVYFRGCFPKPAPAKGFRRAVFAALAGLNLCTISYGQGFERAEVVEVDSTSASELYRRAERWFVDAFKDAQEVVQLRDTVTKVLVGKGVDGNSWSQMTFSLEVACKDGRYKARLYDITISGAPYREDTCCYPCDTTPIPKRGWMRDSRLRWEQVRRDLCGAMPARMDAILASLKSAMLKKEEDW